MQMRTTCSLTVTFLKDQGLPDTEAYQSTLLLSSQKQNAVICGRENCNYYTIYIQICMTQKLQVLVDLLNYQVS